MNVEKLEATARVLLPPGKGILAADESHPSIGRRFEPLGIPNTEETRRRLAVATVGCLRRTVPAAVPGVVFLSGGQSEERATAHLNAMNAPGTSHPWALRFSYGRALHAAALRAWRGDPTRVVAGQQAFYHRARMNGAALHGRYIPDLERPIA